MQAHFVKDHLRGGCSPSHLHSSWLCFTQSSQRSKHIEGVAQPMSRVAVQRSKLSQECKEVLCYLFKINDDVRMRLSPGLMQPFCLL